MSYNYDHYYTEQYKPLAKSGYCLADLKKYANFSQARYRFLRRRGFLKKLKPEMKMLGIGSGIGGFEKVMFDHGFNILGSDVSKKTTEIAGELNKKVKFVQLDVGRGDSPVGAIHELPLQNLFDCIFCFEVLEHLENPETAVANMAGLLKKGGYFIGTTPYQPKFELDPTHINEKSIIEWSKIFAEAGFKILFFKDVSFFPYLYRFSPCFSWCFPYKAKTKSVNRYIISTQFFGLEKR